MLVLILFLLMLRPTDTFWLRASARALSATQQVRLTCFVSRDDANRAMVMGVQDEASSEFTLDGARAAQIHERWFGPLSGGEQLAFCRVLGSAGQVLHSTTLRLIVQDLR